MIKSVFLTSCFSKLKANLYVNELNSRGIYTFLKNEHTSEIIPLGGGGHEIHVDIDRLDEALTIIEEMDANFEKEESFHEATQEDIEYEQLKQRRALEKEKSNVRSYILLGVAIAILLIAYLFRNKIL